MITLLVLTICSMQFVVAQFYKTIRPAASFSDSLAIVVQDFKYNFKNIEGKQLPDQQEMEVFQSTATVPGALHCIISRFHSTIDTTAAWQAIMYEGDSYDEAVKVYKETYKQMKKTKMKWVDKSIISFVGDMEVPDENLRFTVTSMRLNIIDRPYRSFFGELEMTYTYEGWSVHLNLLSKKNDAEQY